MKEINKKMFIIFHGRFPSEKAASLFAAKSCEAFASEGFNVELIIPKRKGLVEANPFEYYSVKENFKVRYVDVIDLFDNSINKKVAFWISQISFVISSTFFILKNGNRGNIIYSNEPPNLFALSFFRENTFYEMHDFPESKLWLFGIFLKRMKWILIHNNWKIEELRKQFGFMRDKKILHQPNAVEIKDFDISVSKEEARKMLDIEKYHKIVLYTGHLYGWKGVDTLASVAPFIPKDTHILFVGGTEKDIYDMEGKYAQYENVHFVGHKKHTEIPLWQKAADVLVLPNTAKEKISKYYTSPMKLFEYMASGVPIVASDIPSIREIVDGSMVSFAIPDNSNSLADAIETVLNNIGDVLSKVEKSYNEVQKYTWGIRAKNIIKHIEQV